MRRSRARPALALSVVAATACGSSLTDAPPPVSNQLPVVEILSPQPFSWLPSDAPVVLRARVTDVEDGLLSGPSLRWSSAENGPLGTGDSLAVLLPLGDHTLRLSARDTEGGITLVAMDVRVATPVSDSALATVVDLVIRPSDFLMYLGSTRTIAGIALSSSGDEFEVPVVWSSGDAGVATVDGLGRVATGRTGTTTLTATFQSHTRASSIVVERALSSSVRDYVEALFLGTGRLRPSDGFSACVAAPRWGAFPQGASIRVLLSNTLDKGADGADTKALVRAALGDIPIATDGWLTIGSVENTPDPDPIPGAFEVTATDHPDPVSTGCGFDRGCVHVDFEARAISSVRVVIRESLLPSDAFVHDLIGHGILGLCHIDQQLVGGNQMTLMAGGPGALSGAIPDRLSGRDLTAVQAVYRVRPSVAAQRDEFIELGLIEP